jgi:L,D-peptidoglycan transpeptidase YkuD (ErfK/YbiS/YcfS/YnhG family)
MRHSKAAPADRLAIRRLRVFAGVGGRSRGVLAIGTRTIPCALGRSGVVINKREGDGGTPPGIFALGRCLIRRDRLTIARAAFPLHAIRPDDGWSDEPASPRYNRRVALPCRESHERLWRDDGLYDIVFCLDYNLWPRRRGRGSAIFLHIASPGYAPTEGCVAISHADMRRLLPRLARDARLEVRLPGGRP